MAATLVGKVKYNKVMQGTYKSGKRQGEEWEFLSLEIIDTATGFTWNCQVPAEDPSYKAYQDNELKEHKVRVRITSQSAGERQMPNGQTRLQIRSQLTRLEDLGIPDDDE